MLIKEIQEKFPFLSIVVYGGQEYIGIIANQDQWVTSMFVYTSLKSEQEKKALLDLGEVWWWESNRMIPINIFLKNDFTKLNILHQPDWFSILIWLHDFH